MARFTINFRGIGIIYSRSDVWRIIFPIEGCHNLKLTDHVDKEKPLGIPRLKRVIEFEVGRSRNGLVSKFEKGDRYGNFLNLTASYAHFQEPIRIINGWDNDAVLMKIPNAIFSVDESNFSTYEMIGRAGNAKTFDRYRMSYYGKAEISAPSLKLKISDDDGAFSVYREYRTDSNILFDNGCDGRVSDRNGDMRLVYNVIDERYLSNKFSTRRHRDDEPENKVRAPRSGNPLPDIEKGLPCHQVKIGNPGSDLP